MLLLKVDVTDISRVMGGGVRDNIILTDVSKGGEVSFRLKVLKWRKNNSLGELKDYENPN